MGKDKDFSVLLSPDMYCIICPVLFIPVWKHSRKNRKIKLTEKLAILQFSMY